jgi:hypothetical protein
MSAQPQPCHPERRRARLFRPSRSANRASRPFTGRWRASQSRDLQLPFAVCRLPLASCFCLLLLPLAFASCSALFLPFAVAVHLKFQISNLKLPSDSRSRTTISAAKPLTLPARSFCSSCRRLVGHGFSRDTNPPKKNDSFRLGGLLAEPYPSTPAARNRIVSLPD